MSLWIVLLLALLFVTVGFIGGALVTLAFADRNQDDKPAPEKRTRQDERRTPESLVNLYREKGSGRFVVEAGGKQYLNKDELSEKDLKEQIALAREWLAWAGDFVEMPQRMNAVPPTPAPAETIEEAPALYEPERMPAVRAPQPVAVPEPPNRKGKKDDDKKKEEPPATIVSQINDILQERLAGSALDERGIKLTEDERGGVVVWVGPEHYNGLDAIPDADVRAEIRAAVQTWERRAEEVRLKTR